MTRKMKQALIHAENLMAMGFGTPTQCLRKAAQIYKIKEVEKFIKYAKTKGNPVQGRPGLGKTYDFLLLDYTNETARWFQHREDAEVAEFGLMSENAATDVFRVHSDRVLLMDSNYRWHDAPADMVDKILSQWRKINRIKKNPKKRKTSRRKMA